MEIKFTGNFWDSYNRLFGWRWAPYRWCKAFLGIPRDMKHLYQRMVRGWADSDVWSMENYISDVCIGMLGHLKANHCGRSMEFSGGGTENETGEGKFSLSDEEACKACEDCLQEMIDGFKVTNERNELENPDFKNEESKKAWQDELDRLDAKQKRGLALFAEHFNSLWD